MRSIDCVALVAAKIALIRPDHRSVFSPDGARVVTAGHDHARGSGTHAPWYSATVGFIDCSAGSWSAGTNSSIGARDAEFFE